MTPGRLSFVPDGNGWTVIAHESIVSLLDPSVSTGTIERLRRTITSPDVTVESYVASIPLFGADAVDRFAVVVLDAAAPHGRDDGAGSRRHDAAARITLVLRGTVHVELTTPTGTRIVDGRHAVPWYLAEFDAVSALTLASAPPRTRGAEHRPLTSAVETASAVQWAAAHAGTDGADTHVAGTHVVVTDAGALEDTVLGADATAAIPIIRTGRPAVDGDDADGMTLARIPTLDETSTNDDTNDTHADGADAAPEPRPVFSFRVGRGAPISLDSAVYLGRKPSPPRVPRGPLPTLIRVDSPSQEVSSTHAEIRQEGSAVVVTDLRSTNGTGVCVPGAPRLTLRQGESIVVAPGTLIDLGDGNVVEILPAQVPS
ncbi:FHA domain-containing protein [Planctomonas psychrotolerans]|uniref:FHA domain-containing protein n=1 Tax=Planctomonas psychrotolerans TaxID=2528712 RepID=UPI00123AFB6B|nr:FHA domain-containing protein [Planctomonas psychrotolerans]